MCCHRPDTPEPVAALYVHKDRAHRPSLQDLENTLLATMIGFSHVYLVIDALDECPLENNERKKLLRSLRLINKAGYENLHLLCTSRPENDISAIIKKRLGPGGYTVDLLAHKAAMDQDIRRYIDQTFEANDYESWGAKLKEKARATLVKKADGM